MLQRTYRVEFETDPTTKQVTAKLPSLNHTADFGDQMTLLFTSSALWRPKNRSARRNRSLNGTWLKVRSRSVAPRQEFRGCVRLICIVARPGPKPWLVLRWLYALGGGAGD